MVILFLFSYPFSSCLVEWKHCNILSLLICTTVLQPMKNGMKYHISWVIVNFCVCAPELGYQNECQASFREVQADIRWSCCSELYGEKTLYICLLSHQAIFSLEYHSFENFSYFHLFFKFNFILHPQFSPLTFLSPPHLSPSPPPILPWEVSKVWYIRLWWDQTPPPALRLSKASHHR